MADGKITYQVKLDTDGVDKGLNDVEGKAQSTAGKIGKIFSAIAIGKALKDVVSSGLGFNAELEGYQTSFEVMTGSAEQAYDIVDRLKTQASQTPFDLTQLAKTTQLMMNYGIEGDKALDMMTRLGDVAQGDAAKLDSVSLAYAQMSSLGKVQLMDIKQMINGGFNPLQEISERTGESMESLYDRISKGTLSVNEINEAIIRATSVGGKYFQSMDKQSQTLRGRWNTLKDTAREATGKITEGISGWLASSALPKAIDMVGWLGDNFKDLIPIMAAATAGALALKIALNWDSIVGSISNVIQMFTQAFANGGIWGVIIAALAAVVSYVTALGIEVNKPSEGFREWQAELDKVNAKIKGVGDDLGGIPDLMTATGNSIKSTSEQANEYIDRLAELEEKSELTSDEQKEWNNILSMLTGIIPEVSGLIDDETGAIEGGTDALRDYVTEWERSMYIKAMADTMTQAIQTQMDAIQARTEAYQMFQDAQAEYIDLASQEQAIIESVNETFGLQVTSLEDAYFALEDVAGGYGENAQAAADMQRTINELIPPLEESKKKVDLASQAVRDANAVVDTANGKVDVLTKAQSRIASGQGDLAQIWDDCTKEMMGASDELVATTADNASAMEGVTSDMKVLMRRNYDEGLVRALQDAGMNSVAAMNWLTSQTDSQIKSWNDLFAKDAKDAVSQISKAFQNSDAGKQASAMARTVENNFKPSLYGSGASAADGAISGLNSRRNSLASTASSLASTVMRNFNVRLAIKSPSRVMAESGQYVVEGVEVGIKERLGALKSVAVKAADTVSGAFKPTIDMSGLKDMGTIQTIQQNEMVSQMAAQVNSAPINVHMNIDGQEFAMATALPMSYALETLRVAEARG